MLVAVSLLVSLPAAAVPKVDMGRAQTRGDQLTAPTNQGLGVLTLDPKLQGDVETLLRRSRAPEAAAIVIDVRTGKVLAWASVDDSGRDLVAQPYGPPASLFKVITAAALIEQANVKNNARQCYIGGQRNVFLRDLRTSGAGGASCSTFATAVGYSQNMVMAGLAVRHLEQPALQDMAERFGFNGRIPIDIAVGAGSARVPSSKEGLARAAAGFGPGTLTPLEAAYMMTIVARNGVRPPIQLLDHIEGPKGRPLAAPPSSVGPNRAINTSTAQTLKQMLEVTVREGTAAKAFRDEQGRRYLGTQCGGGKTGTLSRGKPRRLFSWYAGYAPSENPEIAVAVMLANDPKWWRKGPDVARDVLRAYFARNNMKGITHPIRGATARRSK